MIIAQILLIVLVAAPVLALAFYLWFVLEEYVRNKNNQDKVMNPPAGRRRK